MNHLAQETLWICLAIFAGTLGYLRGRRSEGRVNCHDGSVERQISLMAGKFTSMADENRRICEQIETLHRRISWIRSSDATLAAEEAAQ